jgi:heme oxygenase
MPKSWMSSPEKVRSDRIQSEARYLVGQNYNRYLKQVASDNGVKLGNVKRTAGIQEKLTKKGVQFFDKATFGGSKGWEVAYREETKLKDGRVVVSVWK